MLEKISKLYFQLFFFSNCHKVIPYNVSKVKKQKTYSMYVLCQIKKHIFTSKLFGKLKLSKQKKF